MLISQAIESFLLDCQARNLRPASIVVYRRQLTHFSEFAHEMGIDALAGVDVRLIRQFIIHEQNRGLAAGSIRTSAKSLRAWLNFCVSDEFLNQSPFRNVRMPKEDHHKPDIYTADEVLRLLEACKSQRDRAIVLVLLDTGLRVGEFSALRIGDVNLTTGAILAQRATKSRSDKTVYLGQRSRAELAAHLAQTPNLSPDLPLWRTHTGYKLNIESIKKIIRRLGKRANVKRCSPNKFRRTFASWALHDGMDIYTVAELMGHSTIDLLKHYLSLSDEDLQRAHQMHGPVDHLLK